MLERKYIEQIDSKHMLASIEVFDKQCSDSWNATKNLAFSKNYNDIERIVLFGMGGSALGIHLIKTLFSDKISIPIEIVSDYSIPKTINDKTLAILSSYSGTTEETIAACKPILKMTKKIFIITTGGYLKKFAFQNKIPSYIIDPKYNPSGQPRMAVGYSVMGICGALSSLGIIKISDRDVKTMTLYIKKLQQKFGADVPKSTNIAKQLALNIHGHLPVIISAEFLEGATHVFTNQINENGKHFATRFMIPEMNHHLIEGLVHPRTSLDKLQFLFINSSLYNKRNQLRFLISKKILKKNKITFTELRLQGKTKFNQVFELLLIGSYISFYLAILNNIDPSPIPNVNYLKEELSKT